MATMTDSYNHTVKVGDIVRYRLPFTELSGDTSEKTYYDKVVQLEDNPDDGDFFFYTKRFENEKIPSRFITNVVRAGTILRL